MQQPLPKVVPQRAVPSIFDPEHPEYPCLNNLGGAGKHG